MSTAIQPLLATLTASALPLPVHRFSVADYHRLVATGVLPEIQPVELLNGWIVDKMPHNPPHDSMIDLLMGELLVLLPAPWYPRAQSAITTEDSEPEPDIAVVKGPRGRYREWHPTGLDIGTVVEVSESTLQQDRAIKSVVYARAGIPYYWIVNIPGRCIEVFFHPLVEEGRYASHKTYALGELIPLILDGIPLGEIPVDRLFGK